MKHIKQPLPQQQRTAPIYTLGLLLTLYLAQGLPVGFITQALPTILREYKASLTLIGWTGFLLMPWAVKFMWAPLVDRFFSPRIGQSKSWIVPMQLLSAGLLVFIALLNPTSLVNVAEVKLLFVALFLVSLFGASHDIATDALATRTLDKAERGSGNAAQVTGYRLGLICGGGVFLIIMDTLSWQLSFMLMAGLVLLNTVPIVMHKEPAWQDKQTTGRDTTTGDWFKAQFGYFWQSPEMRAWLLVLVTFKVVDGMSSGMVKPMMKDMGETMTQIGLWGSILGSAASLLGAMLAALLMRRMTRIHALIGFNVFQLVTTGLYGVVAFYFEAKNMLPVWTVYAANAIEHAAAAMALVAMLSTVMDYARSDKAGSDFTFQVCILASFSGSMHIISGYIADHLGYTGLFLSSVSIGLFMLLPLVYWHRIKSQAMSVRD